MDAQINQLLSATAMGLSGYILYKLFTTQLTTTVEYKPFVGYADDINNSHQTYATNPVLDKSQGHTYNTSDGTRVYQLDENIYIYDQ